MFKDIIEWLDTLVEAKKTLYDNKFYGMHSVCEGIGQDGPELCLSSKTFNAVTDAITEPITFYSKEFNSKWGKRKTVSFFYKDVKVYCIKACVMSK